MIRRPRILNTARVISMTLKIIREICKQKTITMEIKGWFYCWLAITTMHSILERWAGICDLTQSLKGYLLPHVSKCYHKSVFTGWLITKRQYAMRNRNISRWQPQLSLLILRHKQKILKVSSREIPNFPQRRP